MCCLRSSISISYLSLLAGATAFVFFRIAITRDDNPNQPLSPKQNPGGQLSRSFSRDVGYYRSSPQAPYGPKGTVGVPDVRTSVARISATQHQPRPRMRVS